MKKYQCVCGKSFFNGRSLQGHERRCEEYKKSKELKRLELLREKELKRLPNGMFVCENPKCKKEHDGSYGSGRFCSDSCRRSFNAQQNDFEHIRTKRIEYINGNPSARSPHGTWKCKNCNLIFNTRRELFAHNKENHPHEGTGWNKGLTKYTDKRVAENAKNVSKTMKEKSKLGLLNKWFSDGWTDEMRKTFSDMKKKLYMEHPEKHPNRKLANNKHKMTYPEKIAFEWLTEHNINFVNQYKLVLEGNARYVDFLVNNNIIIEIDGDFWHPIGNKNDFCKDELAKKHGYVTYRIRASERIIDKLQEIFG